MVPFVAVSDARRWTECWHLSNDPAGRRRRPQYPTQPHHPQHPHTAGHAGYVIEQRRLADPASPRNTNERLRPSFASANSRLIHDSSACRPAITLGTLTHGESQVHPPQRQRRGPPERSQSVRRGIGPITPPSSISQPAARIDGRLARRHVPGRPSTPSRILLPRRDRRMDPHLG